MTSSKKIAVIAGAGPAGLTAALELLRRSDIAPIVIESDGQVGGISKTVNYRGNRMDLGGHRFFSKSDWVMQWWQEILPIAHGQADSSLQISYQRESRQLPLGTTASIDSEAVMLVRRRLSRIFYRRRFFDYPLKINASTIQNMGLLETLRIGLSYGRSQLSFRGEEKSLEHFLVNRFGTRLYETFFKDYTEKVWGVPCSEISAEWGAQRIKGLSISKAIAHALTRPLKASTDTSQKRTETSLIERFLYPKYGPGQMWEEVAQRIVAKGGEVLLNQRVCALEKSGDKIVAAMVQENSSGSVRRLPCDYLISTMPVRDVCAMLQPEDPTVVRIASGLPYRDFMTAGLLLRKMQHPQKGGSSLSRNGMPPDNWIYIQEPDVKIGRLQVFNNWSPYLVADPETIWLGLEYFCREGDELWSMRDSAFLSYAAGELQKIGLVLQADVLDGTVVRVPKAYPAYFGQYHDFDQVRAYLERFANLYTVGRNGMHRYNNQDHSMLAGNAAVNLILSGGTDKSAIWTINAEDDYHESRR